MLLVADALAEHANAAAAGLVNDSAAIVADSGVATAGDAARVDFAEAASGFRHLATEFGDREAGDGSVIEEQVHGDFLLWKRGWGSVPEDAEFPLFEQVGDTDKPDHAPAHESLLDYERVERST